MIACNKLFLPPAANVIPFIFQGTAALMPFARKAKTWLKKLLTLPSYYSYILATP
jgi:hypothetical protein